MMKTFAPWSKAQVAALNAFQVSGRLHPFTCPHDYHPSHRNCPMLLVAREDGWHCYDSECDYTQNWAHEWMTDGDPDKVVPEVAESFRERVMRTHPVSPGELEAAPAIATGGNAEDCENCTAAVREGKLDYPWICTCEKPRRPVRQICAVLHTDAEGNVVPCPDAVAEGLLSPAPGSRKEQLPDRILALLRPVVYLSTACETATRLFQAVAGHPDRAEELHAWEKRLHQRCRLNHKFTGVLCECDCHTEGGVVPGVVLPQSLE